jgi:hypothetical protein
MRDRINGNQDLELSQATPILFQRCARSSCGAAYRTLPLAQQTAKLQGSRPCQFAFLDIRGLCSGCTTTRWCTV